ncbi:unnamed protein product, partial [Phaeothamnion confervicola]
RLPLSSSCRAAPLSMMNSPNFCPGALLTQRNCRLCWSPYLSASGASVLCLRCRSEAPVDTQICVKKKRRLSLPLKPATHFSPRDGTSTMASTDGAVGAMTTSAVAPAVAPPGLIYSCSNDDTKRTAPSRQSDVDVMETTLLTGEFDGRAAQEEKSQMSRRVAEPRPSHSAPCESFCDNESDAPTGNASNSPRTADTLREDGGYNDGGFLSALLGQSDFRPEMTGGGRTGRSGGGSSSDGGSGLPAPKSAQPFWRDQNDSTLQDGREGSDNGGNGDAGSDDANGGGDGGGGAAVQNSARALRRDSGGDASVHDGFSDGGSFGGSDGDGSDDEGPPGDGWCNEQDSSVEEKSHQGRAVSPPDCGNNATAAAA